MTEQRSERAGRRVVADYEASDQTQRESTSERGVSFSNLRNWIYRLRNESRPRVPEAAKGLVKAPREGPTPRLGLLPVRV
jgi:transposase-like protein